MWWQRIVCVLYLCLYNVCHCPGFRFYLSLSVHCATSKGQRRRLWKRKLLAEGAQLPSPAYSLLLALGLESSPLRCIQELHLWRRQIANDIEQNPGPRTNCPGFVQYHWQSVGDMWRGLTRVCRSSCSTMLNTQQSHSQPSISTKTCIQEQEVGKRWERL